MKHPQLILLISMFFLGLGTLLAQSNVQNFNISQFQQAGNCTLEYEDMMMTLEDFSFPPEPFCGPFPMSFSFEVSTASITKTFLPGTKIRIDESSFCFTSFYGVYCDGNELKSEYQNSDPNIFTYDVVDGLADSIVIIDFECGLFDDGDRTINYTIENAVYELQHFQEPNRANSTAIKLEDVELLEENKPNFKLTADGSDASVFKLLITNNPASVSLNDLPLKMRIKEDPDNSDSKRYGRFSIDSNSSSNSKVEYKYRHPDHIPDGESRNLTIELIDSVKNVVLDEFPLRLSHAPVLLVHGLWSNDATFIELENFLVSNGYDSERVFKVSYESTNAVSFGSNNNVIPGGILSLQSRLENRGIAGGKVDIVGHSMGGILTRLYLQSAGYKDDIGKFITINTPHSGSQIANFILSNDTRAVIARPLFNQLSMPTNQGAINDLRVNSTAITVNLNGPTLNANTVPSHAIVSQTNLALEVTQATNNLVLQGSVYGVMMQIGMDDALLTAVYGQTHDIIVPFTSQFGGLPAAATTNFLGTSHIENQKFFGSLTVINNLLKSPSCDPGFHSGGFAPPTLTYAAPLTSDPEVIDKLQAGTINITSPLDGQTFSTIDNIDIEVSGSASVDSIYCMIPFNLDSLYIGRQFGTSASFDYNEPRKTGTVKIYAIGYENGTIILDSTFVHICDTTLDLNPPVFSTSNFNSAFDINATGGVEDQAAVRFEAGNSVNLLPGFYVEEGATFEGKIGDCNSENGLKEEDEIVIKSQYKIK